MLAFLILMIFPLKDSEGHLSTANIELFMGNFKFLMENYRSQSLNFNKAHQNEDMVQASHLEILISSSHPYSSLAHE